VISHRDEPGLIVAARRNLPLVIGLGEGENFVGSDVTAFIAHTRTARASSRTRWSRCGARA
jgi:glucosamine--fructose-6-phosphate aminotransferase (isomerizing)